MTVRTALYKASVEPTLEGVATYIQNSIIVGDANYSSYQDTYADVGSMLNAGEAMLNGVADM